MTRLVTHPEIPIGYITTAPEDGAGSLVSEAGLVILPDRGDPEENGTAAALLWRMYGRPNKKS